MSKYIGRFASIMSIAMYSSYVDQIRLNLSGQHGSIIIPIFTTINCIAWTIYGTQKKEYPIVFCNAPGIVFALIALYTSI